MPQTLAEIRQLLESHGLSPRKSLGQNFLIDQNLVRKLVDAAGVGVGDLVLEVGPGTGTLTEELLSRRCEVVASELDRGLAAMLRERLGAAHPDRFRLVEGDCLAGKRHVSPDILAALRGRPFTLVANLPYNAATPLMISLLVEHPECRGLFVTVQREVADRLLARPSTKEYGTLGVVAQALGEAKRIATLPPACFWPRPDVTSAMASVVRRGDPATDNPFRLAAFCQAAFSKRRKQLGSVLGKDVPWPEGVSPHMRIEELTPAQIAALSAVADPDRV